VSSALSNTISSDLVCIRAIQLFGRFADTESNGWFFKSFAEVTHHDDIAGPARDRVPLGSTPRLGGSLSPGALADIPIAMPCSEYLDRMAEPSLGWTTSLWFDRNLPSNTDLNHLAFDMMNLTALRLSDHHPVGSRWDRHTSYSLARYARILQAFSNLKCIWWDMMPIGEVATILRDLSAISALEIVCFPHGWHAPAVVRHAALDDWELCR